VLGPSVLLTVVPLPAIPLSCVVPEQVWADTTNQQLGEQAAFITGLLGWVGKQIPHLGLLAAWMLYRSMQIRRGLSCHLED